ncbi:IclR family transcriptional regulator [Pelagibacterium lacus]|uniref:IclR family transcriptional regulator n=1 Tax=Pelagibacterium lacus TaxID=2282655 RepID=UPI0011C06921|nr:IclR family transcriptional regulator [Pelagibacterium lacus]
MSKILPDALPATGRPADKPTGARVKVLGKTFHILEVLSRSEEPLAVASIARLTGLNRSTVHRTVQMLLEAGYVEQSAPGSSRFAIGPQTLPLAASYLNQNQLRSVALSHLYPLTLQTGLRGHLGIHSDGEVMYLGGFEKPEFPTIYTWFGRQTPMHCSSLGKSLMAYMPGEAVDGILALPLRKFTENTITDPATLKEQLTDIRKNGYAFDDAEHIENNYCLGAPILSNGDAVAAISIATRDKDELFKALPALLRTAATISQAISGTIRL